MKELSLHILDIAENSISACAKNIDIKIIEDTVSDLLQINIKDDGKGMDAEAVSKLSDPFHTTRTTRRVGLGIPLFKEAAEACNGSLEIASKPGYGTEVKVTFQYSHIDRMPLGDLPGTLLGLMVGTPEINWRFHYSRDGRLFELESHHLMDQLQDVPLSDPFVIKWLREYIRNGILDVQNIRDMN